MNIAHTVKNVNGVIFDLDGTLLDTEPLSTQAIEAVLKEHHGEDGEAQRWTVSEEVKARIIGLRDLDWARLVLTELQVDGLSPERLVQGWHGQLEVLYPTAQLLPGAMECVRYFKEDRKAAMAIATSSSSGAVQLKKVAQPKLFEAMDVVVAGDDANVKKGKPAPDIFLEAAARLGLAPENCVAFEDSPHGIVAARRAGVGLVVGVPDGRYWGDEARQEAFQEAHLIVDSLNVFLEDYTV